MTWQRIFRYVTKNKQQTKKHNLDFIKSKCFCFKRYHQKCEKTATQRENICKSCILQEYLYKNSYNSIVKLQISRKKSTRCRELKSGAL